MKAVAYYRTSSASNVGEDKDSKLRQRDAVMAYAASRGIEIVGEFYDAAVRGTDSITDRPGFSDMLEYIASNGAKTILVENAGRFARDIVVQITGYEYLKNIGVCVVPVDSPQHFMEDTPSAEMIRGILGIVSQFEKKSLVDKMRKARERKRLANGRCEGRKPAPDDAISLARQLRGEGLTLREIGCRLAGHGYFVRKRDSGGRLVNSDKVYGPQSVKVMLTSTEPRGNIIAAEYIAKQY